jgi:predicted transcriptional regulator
MLDKYNNINQTTLKILGLYKNDYQATFYLREISRESHADVKTVQLQLKKLEQKNLIQSQQKGKNKEYTLNLNNYLTLYHLILAETFATIEYLDKTFEIKKLVSQTNTNMGSAALLFGSFAKGNMNEDSDIDLMIIDSEKPN